MSIDEVYAGMQAAIDEAWETTDPILKEDQARIFPNGKPKPGEFLVALADKVKEMID